MASDPVAVVGADADRLADDIDSYTGVEVSAGAAAADADVVLASGVSALADLVRAGTDATVLPVDAGAGVRSVPSAAADEAIADVVTGEYETATRPVLSVSVDGADPVRSLFDVTLVTSEPARISEYSVTAGPTRVAELRADGIVVATAAGSHEYAEAAGGPVLDPETDAVAVTPIAPFVTGAKRWVVPHDDVTLSVERDEGGVSLLVDGRNAGAVPHDTAVRIARTDALKLAVVEASRSFY
ncbi:NAD(+)/NADH kinase [Halostella pelagica]|uniref:NAD(+)/NADH kinase n=1 Tax=Halostella pelagica TaxID=2583824 RepID=UPI001080B178|nr:NAD(+)/NADH kinase [Halostella pelagica]